jgi:hypothetical protein
MATQTDLEIQQGKTFSRVLRWEAPPVLYKAITGITNGAPVRLTVPSHDIPNNWRAAVQSVKGMTQINAVNTPPKAKDFNRVTVVDADTVEFNTINASEFSIYKSGGYLVFNTPVDLTGMTARMTIKDRVGGSVLDTLTTETGGISVDTATNTINLLISATDTAAYEWQKGVYDLELISSGGVVTLLLFGAVAVVREVTT